MEGQIITIGISRVTTDDPRAFNGAPFMQRQSSTGDRRFLSPIFIHLKSVVSVVYVQAFDSIMQSYVACKGRRF